MQSIVDISEGRARLQEILRERPSNSDQWNEAQNRFHFVDRLMKECLGWDHPHLQVEETDDGGGRADYLLGKPIKGILEAKRESVRFNFPPTTQPKKGRKISGLIESCPDFKKAFLQIVPYCAYQGAPIGVICNGPQLVIFQALASEQKPADGFCFVFDGFEKYVDDFNTLWSLLSPEGIATNRAKNLLSSDANRRIPPKASLNIYEPQKYRFRTDFQENLRVLATVLLDTIEDNEEISDEFDEECYVDTKANKRHLLLSKNAIQNRYRRAALEGVKAAEIGLKNGTLPDEVLIAGRSPKPIVVLGDVGVGKTSFFRHLYKSIQAIDETFYLRIDLGRKGTLSHDFKSFIIEDIPNLLKQKHSIDIFTNHFGEIIYANELRDFDESPEGQIKEIDEKSYLLEKSKFLTKLVRSGPSHLMRSLEYIARNKCNRLIIVIDNADQRDYETQQQAFLAAAEIAAISGVMVFVSLRPSTFYRSKISGALSGYETKVFTISPPPAEEVIRKRLTFGLRVAEGKVAPAALEGVRLNLTNIVLFIKATLRSLKSNSDIRIFLSNITGGNTRQVVELITSFVGSPNVESEKIVRIEGETGDYKVPFHEFTKHALLGEYAYFHPASSFVAHNLFDTKHADPREHFLSSLIIAHLTSGQASQDRDGYAAGADLVSEMSRLGFLESQIESQVTALATSRLIETPHGHFRESDIVAPEPIESLHFKATSIGAYHIRYWCGNFSFLDAVSIDTPIYNGEARKLVYDLASSHQIGDRFEKANAFRHYLADVWDSVSFDAPYYNFIDVLDSQNGSFESVAAFLDRRGTG